MITTNLVFTYPKTGKRNEFVHRKVSTGWVSRLLKLVYKQSEFKEVSPGVFCHQDSVRCQKLPASPVVVAPPSGGGSTPFGTTALHHPVNGAGAAAVLGR